MISGNFSDPKEGIRDKRSDLKIAPGCNALAFYSEEFKTLTKLSGYDQMALFDQFFRGQNENSMNFMILPNIPESLE
ncbi:hypothetical protein AYI69_g10793 [Smittium culicis]|uniref:Uncharacterized protein n=1 Tax=Smittium culicis TaxID=133412 RepID=A0A1R1X3E0_9FUNG|nr:hypothetical protein AYI69_g10793 [Smittium culicis]